MKLENWSIAYSQPNPYTPPERCPAIVNGDVYGHPKFIDGLNINTSSIVSSNGNIVTTKSGSQYELGEPDPDYVAWCREQGSHIPTKENPFPA